MRLRLHQQDLPGRNPAQRVPLRPAGRPEAPKLLLQVRQAQKPEERTVAVFGAVVLGERGQPLDSGIRGKPKGSPDCVIKHCGPLHRRLYPLEAPTEPGSLLHAHHCLLG